MPPKPEEIEWSDLNNIYTPSKLLKEFGETGGLPVIVQVVQGHHGENTVDCIDTHQVLMVTAFESQRRVIARDRHGRLISMPEQWPVKFRVRETGVKRSKPKTLQEIFRDYSHKLPVNAYFDKMPKWSFKTGKKTKSNLKYGGVEILNVYTEIFMKAMPVYDGIISVYERELVTLPLYVLVHMRVAQGLVESNQPEWQKVKDKYVEEVKHINFNKVHGTCDVLLYDHRFYMFYEALKKEIHPEEMSFHFAMPSDHVTTDHVTTGHVTTDYSSPNKAKGEDNNNNNTNTVTGGSKRRSQGHKVDEIPTVTVTDTVNETQTQQDHIGVTEKTVQEDQSKDQQVVVTQTGTTTRQSDERELVRENKPSTPEVNVSSTQPVVVTGQRTDIEGSDASSVQGEVMDRQTEIDEDGRRTTVSIQVVSVEDEHYHSTDSGIQTNSPHNISPQHQQHAPHTTVIDVVSNSPQRQHSAKGGVSHLRQDEDITYPGSHMYTESDRGGGRIIQDGPHVSKVEWVEPTKQTPTYPSYQAHQVDQPMRLHLTQTGRQSNPGDGGPMFSQSYTDVRTTPPAAATNAVYYMNSDRPVRQQRTTSSRSVQDYPVRYHMSGSNAAINRPRPSYPSTSSSSVFYSLKKNEPPVDMRDTVSDIGMSPSRAHYGALHVDIPDSHSQTSNNTFDRYYNVNNNGAYLLGHAQPKVKSNKQRSHSARRHHELIPRQQVYVIDRQDNKKLYPPSCFDQKVQRTSSQQSPRRSPVRVIHIPRGRQPERGSSFVDVITGKVVRKKSSTGDEIDSKFEFRSLDRGNQAKREGDWREVPLSHSDKEEEEEGGKNYYTRNRYNNSRYDRSPSPGDRRQYYRPPEEQPLIKVHGLGVQMVPPGYQKSSYSYQSSVQEDSEDISEVREEKITPKKKGNRYEPAPLAAQEASSVSSSESDIEILGVKQHGNYNSSVKIVGMGDGYYSSKTSTDSFSPKDSTHTSVMSPSSVEQLTPGSTSPPMTATEPLTPTKTYRTTHMVFKTDRGGGHSDVVHSQTVEDITHEVELQSMQGSHQSIHALDSPLFHQDAEISENTNKSNISTKVVMREKKKKTEAKKRSSTNSLRQVYSENNRDSLDDATNIELSVTNNTEEPGFQKVLNSNSFSPKKLSGEFLKGTTRSSGYGSLEHKVVKRSRSPHRVDHQKEGDRVATHNNYDHAVRDSILSIKELDEFLKTQATVDSDSESTREPDIQISRL